MFAHPRVWLALFAVLLLLPGCVQSTVKPVKEQLITSGDSDSRDTVIDIKVKKYEKLVREFPKEPRYRERLARLYWMNKDHRNALKYLDQARRLDPENPKYVYLQGTIYTGIGNYRLAEVSFKELLDGEGSEYTGPYMQLAEICMLQEREDEAIGYLESAAELDPFFSLPYYYLGAIALQNREEETAIAHLETYLRLGGGIHQDEVIQTLTRLQPEIRIHHIR